jgi:hypothetical protein
LAILNYSSASPERSGVWRWAIAIVVGAVIGFGLAAIVYESTLRVLSQGKQLYVFDVYEPFEHRVRFSFVLALTGAIVGCSALAAARLTGRANVAVWVLAFVICYLVAAAAALFVARNIWNRTVGSPGVGSLGPSLASVSLLTPLIVGAVMVVVLLSISVLWCRRMTARPTR